MNKSSILIRSTSISIDDVCARLPDIAGKHKFGVLGTHNLKEKMEGKGVPFDRECRVYEVCNPQQAQSILVGDITVSAALPCRISIYAENGRTMLATIEPAALLGLFGAASPGAEQIANEVRTALVAIMEETCEEPQAIAAATTAVN